MKVSYFKSIPLWVISAIFLMVSSYANAADSLSLRLDWKLTGYHVPFYWAQAKGYYKEQNLDVDIKPGSGSGSTINLVGSHHDDLGFADYLLMATAAAQGMDVKAIYGVVQLGAWAVISHEDKPIRTPDDLRGKSIATTADHRVLLDLFLKERNIPAQDVDIRVTNAATRNTVFDQGVVDGLFSITIGSPIDLVVRAQQGKSKPVHFMPIADYGLATLGQGIITSTEAINTKKDAIRRFIEATDRAFVEAAKPENIDEATEIAVHGSETSSERTASIRLQWLETLKHLETANTKDKPLGWMSEADWATSLDVLRKIGRLNSDVSVSSVFTNDFIPSAK